MENAVKGNGELYRIFLGCRIKCFTKSIAKLSVLAFAMKSTVVQSSYHELCRRHIYTSCKFIMLFMISKPITSQKVATVTLRVEKHARRVSV